jgi:SNF2 family DNA or RNA helicase
MLRTRLIAPYQPDGVRWMAGRELSSPHPGGFLCDEMGLGKTVQILATMLINPKEKTLIIVPKSIVSQWRDEIEKFTPGVITHIYDGPNRKYPEFIQGRLNIVVTPYSVMTPRKGRGEVTPLHMIEWDRVVLDEGHEIRTHKSGIHKSLRLIKAPIRWVMTGTPVFNKMRDFVSLCEFIGIDRRNVQGFTDKIRETYVLRRTKDDVAGFNEDLRLPPCIFENVELQMYPEEGDLYRHIYGECQDAIAEAYADSALPGSQEMIILEALLRVRQCMLWPQMYLDGISVKNRTDTEKYTGRSKKLEYLVNSIKEHPEEKTLVFGHFMGEMDRVQELLCGENIQVFRIDGSVGKDNRELRIKGFKAAGAGAVFLIQIKAGGVGLNLQEATRVYITAPYWNPAAELQAIGRAHRTGQKKTVYVKKLVYDGDEKTPSIEQSIMELQGRKAVICAELLDDERIKEQIPTAPRNLRRTIQILKDFFSSK